MNLSDGLRDSLKSHFGWGKPGLDCFVAMLLALMNARQMNLTLLAIPVYWMILNKRGNSNQRERIALLQRFISQFGSKNILGVLADREFIGGKWWKWLSSKEIPYLVRLKGNQLVSSVTAWIT